MAILHRAYYVSQELQTIVIQKHRSKSGSYTHRSHARGQCIVVYRASDRGLCSPSQVTPRMTMTLSFVSQPARVRARARRPQLSTTSEPRASTAHFRWDLSASASARPRPSRAGDIHAPPRRVRRRAWSPGPPARRKRQRSLSIPRQLWESIKRWTSAYYRCTLPPRPESRLHVSDVKVHRSS